MTTTITSRAGNFTSSQIYRLCGSAADKKTYIEEKRMEAKLGRQLEQDKSSASASWGTYLQHRVTNVLLDTGCKPTKDERRTHPLISNWTGAEDYLRSDLIGEVKCYELKKFCKAHDASTAGFEQLKKVRPEIAWQLVSNAILNKMDKAELCLYVPYQSELNTIRDEDEWQRILPAELFEDKDFQYWLGGLKWKKDDELPYLLKDRHYKNLTLFQFDITETDRNLLTNKIIEATAEMQKR
jgi:hypothetical protein